MGHVSRYVSIYLFSDASDLQVMMCRSISWGSVSMVEVIINFQYSFEILLSRSIYNDRQHDRFRDASASVQSFLLP